MDTDPKRILVIVNVYRPDLGGGILFADLCEGLAERGLDVTVKCAYSYYPEWKDKSGQNDRKIRSTIENGVTVERHWIFIPENPNSLLQRLLYEASFYLSLRRRLPARDSFDLVLCFCPLVGSVAYAAAAKRKARAPMWLNIQDLSAQAAAAGGITGHGGIGRLLLRVQNYLFERADVWSSISEPMIETLNRMNTTGIPVRLVPNWLHRSLEKELGKAATQRAKRTVDTPIRLLYSGNIGTKQDLHRMCEFLHSSRLNFLLRIQGDGGRAQDLRSWITATGDSRFEMHALSDEADLARALHEADYYLITEKSGSGNSFIPSKLIPGMASGTPVLAISDAETPLGQYMESYQPGCRFDWTDLESAVDILTNTPLDSETYQTWASNALARSAYFNRESGIDRCMALIDEMIGSEETR